MKKFTTFACLAMALVFALSATAGDLVERPSIWGAADAKVFETNNFNKAEGDTFLLMGPNGSGAPYIGDFETGKTLDGSNNGWTSTDLTQPTVSHWSVSDYFQAETGLPGNNVAWCGDVFDACAADDSIGGYGNNWSEVLEYRTTIGNPLVSTTVNISGDMWYDTEPGYDFSYLSVKVNGVIGATDIDIWDFAGYQALSAGAGHTYTYLPGQYLNGDEIAVQFRVTSDTGWSDEDCSWYTLRGALQVDNLQVDVINDGVTNTTITDFEGGYDISENGAGPWRIGYPDGAGDFTKIWEALEDADICRTNYSKQVAWIDDGVVVPGTGGTEGITFLYGPSGYIVNNTGGLAGPSVGMHCYAVGPVMDWPDTNHVGMFMAFTVYRHDSLAGNMPGVLYRFMMRSANEAGGDDINVASWVSGGSWYGGPSYTRQGVNWSSSLEPGRDKVQIRVGAWDAGNLIPLPGADGSPAPYFDNIRVITYPLTGPTFAYAENALAQDNFPAIGDIDVQDLSRNSVRFDMGFNVSPPSHLLNDPGDSIAVDCVPARTGAEIVGTVNMHWTLQANPVFDSVRGAAPANPLPGVEVVTDSWAFDFPDTGFLFPGDRLQYYFEATDAIGGTTEPQTKTLPTNLDGYGDFSDPLAYNTAFEIHCLPTVLTVDQLADTYTQPELLFWNDFFNRGGEAEWFGALSALGLQLGVDYDAYWTNRPDNGAGNGIGGRTGIGGIEGYTDMLYCGGDLGVYTWGDGNYDADPGQDIQLISQWLDSGNKDLYVSGDDIVYDLANNVINGLTFVEQEMGLSFDTTSIIDNIGGQATPLVIAEVGNPVFVQATEWIAYGGCLGINEFDGVFAANGGVRLAQFTDPNGNTGAYNYSAATLKIDDVTGSRIVSTPYDLLYVHDAPSAKVAAPKAARTLMMSDILNYFSVSNDPGNTVDVPAGKNFAVFQNEPNPFNPVTTIKYVMPRTGHMTMKVYNVRGQLVKTLIDGVVAEGNGEVVWDGTNNQGSSVSSGVYFYETRTDGSTTVNKMALVK